MKVLLSMWWYWEWFLLGVYSCKSSSGGLGSSAELLSTRATVETVMDNHPDFETFTSRLKLTVPVNGESSFNGTLKIKKDELIQIPLQVPVIRIEAPRIEISRDYITVIDRIISGMCMFRFPT